MACPNIRTPEIFSSQPIVGTSQLRSLECVLLGTLNSNKGLLSQRARGGIKPVRQLQCMYLLMEDGMSRDSYLCWVFCCLRGSWCWSRRGTIRVAVSLERLQANVISVALHPGELPAGVPLGAGVGAGGVARAAAKEATGEDVPPAELSCKVSHSRHIFSQPSYMYNLSF